LTEIKRSFKTACRLAGIDDFTFHDLRHTFATRLNESGVDKISRRDLLGHSTTEMSDDYTHSYDETLQKAVDALPQRAKGDLHKICTKEEKRVSLQLVSGRK
jgi:integrase